MADQTPKVEISQRRLLSFLLSLMCIGVPALLAFNLSPSATFLNQAAALMGWGMFMAWLMLRPAEAGLGCTVKKVALPLASFGLMGVSVVISALWMKLPVPLAFSAVGLLAAAALALMVASAQAAPGESHALQQAFEPFCLALLIAGLFSALIALVQAFMPQWADGNWIATASGNGRVGGNLRQPNHLSSLLLWSLIALIWVHESSIERGAKLNPMAWRGVALCCMALLTFGVVLTVSRTGTVCIALLALWGVIDKKLSRFTRMLLWAIPLVYAIGWWCMSEGAVSSGHEFAGGSQLHRSDLSSSRFGIWANTLWLIAHHPWLGVGWGEFNFAWTLTPFPGRPVAFFDHTHNLPLQLLVEMGIPLGVLALSLMGWALWKAFAACWRAIDGVQLVVRCAFMIVLTMAVHSMLEYPLWYAYFLLPTAFALGICLGAPTQLRAVHTESPLEGPRSKPMSRMLVVTSAALSIASVLSVVDYMRVAAIFSPDADAEPLQIRVDAGQGSVFFAHHADYAAATTQGLTSEVNPFVRSAHYLLDTRLMVAWARAYDANGDVERARYIADRLREFHNPDSTEFFSACDESTAPGQPKPFQCTPAKQNFTYSDFR